MKYKYGDRAIHNPKSTEEINLGYILEQAQGKRKDVSKITEIARLEFPTIGNNASLISCT
jgi:hypothetical protein